LDIQTLGDASGESALTGTARSIDGDHPALHYWRRERGARTQHDERRRTGRQEFRCLRQPQAPTIRRHFGSVRLPLFVANPATKPRLLLLGLGLRKEK
jgi:hypothetical protein